MKEVSCKILDVHFRELRKQGLPEEILARGTPYGVDHLKNGQERIEWSAMARIMANASTIWSDEELIRQGGLLLTNPLFRPFSLVGRLLFDARDFYLWVLKPRSGVGNQLFTCVTASARELGADRIEISLLVDDGYAPCRQFNLCSQGFFTQLPRLVGLPPAQVTMRETARGAYYDVRIPVGSGRLTRLRKTITKPFLAGEVAEELKVTHAALTERYADLERARALVDQQATQLRTAHRISLVVHGDLELDRVVQAVADALVEVAAFVAAEVEVAVERAGQPFRSSASVGVRPPGTPPIVVSLTSRQTSLGQARLWVARGADLDERHRLLEYVVPTISNAIEDALTYAVLEDYRLNLEQKVEARTKEVATARDQLQHTVDRLEEAQATRDRIFANINHELRTPLSNIALLLQEVRKRQSEVLDLASARSLDAIEFNVAQVLHLMDGLLLLAAGQAGKLRMRRVSTDLATLFQQVVASWRPAAEKSSLHLSYRGPSSLQGAVDRNALARLLSNLISNAIKYTPDGGTIRVELNEEDDMALLRVTDDGVGMSEELLGRVFGRFEQGPEPLRTAPRGAGIGLAIVREIAEGHDGSVKVESEEGHGTTFLVELPLAAGLDAYASDLRADSSEWTTPAEARADDDGDEAWEVQRVTASSATVLVAEDEPQLRRALVELLADHYRVLAAPDGEAALALAQRHHPDLLVTDVNMPRMTGIELAERFRDLPGNRLASVIILTAYGQHEVKVAGFEAGAVDYLLKPFEPHELLARIAAQLRQRSLAVRLSDSERIASLALLSAGLAHEFRNPANGIIHAVELLKSELPEELTVPGCPTGDLIAVVCTSAGHLRTLCQQLLGFAGPGKLNLSPESVESLVERAVTLCRHALEGVELRRRISYGGELSCAAPFMVQVLVNLLENSAQAAGPNGWVSISSEADEHAVTLRISDSGPGVAADLREKIFQPFFTTKPVGEGTGLGLPVARRIVEQHGGVLQIVQTPEGTAFEAVFPRPRSAAAE